ncbi:MAG TPA: hypothetical protein VMN36_17025 [Verrucomicrobiales bacterium]|nr:hypothetical protein [Verrucomicrobiales bacterium]
MTIELIQSILGWCAVINIAVLGLWALFFMLAHDFMYRLHSKLFTFSVETFDVLHYAGIAAYKITIIVFNVAPYLAIHLAGR